MPSQQEVQWSQLKVGVLVLVALVSLTALVFLMSGNSGGFFSGRITVRSYFENSAGLKIGAPVNLEGVTIGSVKSIHIIPERKLTPVEVTMRISKHYLPALRTDSKSSLETVGVLGDTVVDINSKFATGSTLQDGAEMQTTETPNLSDVIKSSQGTIEQLNTILAKVDNLVDAMNTGKGSIGKLITDPGLYNRAVGTLNEIQGLVDQVSNGKGSIGKLLVDDTLYNRANAIVDKLGDVTNQIDSGKGNIGKFLKDETVFNNLKESTQNLNALLRDINAGKGSIGILAKDPKFADKLNDTVNKLDSILNRVDSGEGTIGQLMRNRSLYDHSDEMIQNTNNLVTAVRQNPKKYLTIHLKIF